MTANYQATNLGSTSVGFYIDGGSYGITGSGSWNSETATLQKLSLDGSTYVPTAVVFSSNSYLNAALAAGTYRIALSGTAVTAVYVDVSRVPGPIGISS